MLQSDRLYIAPHPKDDIAAPRHLLSEGVLVICRLFRFFALLTICCSTGTLFAGPPSEQLLPDTTKGVLFISNWEQLEAAFNKTQFGQLTNDPVMKPFVDDFKEQLNSKGSKRLEKFGIKLEDLRDVPGGEIAFALTQPAADRAAVVMIVDITGHEKQAAAMRMRVSENLAKQGARRTARSTADLVEFEMPRDQNATKSEIAVNATKKQFLLLSNDYATVESIIRAIDAPRKDSLASITQFTQVQGKLKGASGILAPHVRWWVDPFGYSDAAKILEPPKEKPTGTDWAKLLRNQGFGAIQALGGYVNFATGPQELLHRTFVYAPAVKGREGRTGGDKYALGAQMLEFPNSSNIQVQPWVPRELATYSSFNLNTLKAFKSFGSIADEYLAQPGGFEDVLEGLKNDANGPKVDVENEIVANLGQRVTILSDYVLPITPKSERMLFAVETTNEVAVKEGVRKAMQNEEGVKKVEYQGHTIWENSEAETKVACDELVIENSIGDVHHSEFIETEYTVYQAPKGRPGIRNRNRFGKNQPGQPNQNKPAMPSKAIVVCYGHLFVGSNIDFLKKVLDHAQAASIQKGGAVMNVANQVGIARLDTSADLNMVMMEMEQAFDAKQISMRLFSRTDEEFRPNYELLRNGEMAKSETAFGKLLNKVLGDDKEGSTRKQKIDGSKLPEFDIVRRYLGPAGAFMVSQDDGWLLTGFTLRKQVNAAETPTAPRR